MSSSGILYRVVLVRSDVSEELIAFIIRVFSNLPILVALMMEEIRSSETAVLN
jgi:hypothetical protein